MTSCITNVPVSLEKHNGVDAWINGTCIEERILKVTFEDFEKSKMKVRPSAMREVCIHIQFSCNYL